MLPTVTNSFAVALLSAVIGEPDPKDNVPLPLVVKTWPLEPSETFNSVIPTEFAPGVIVPTLFA